MGYIKHTDFGSLCQPEPIIDMAFPKFLKYYEETSSSHQSAIYLPDVRPLPAIFLFLRNHIGCPHLWQAGAWVLCSDRSIDISKCSDFPENCEMSVLTGRLLIQAFVRKENGEIDIDYSRLSNATRIETTRKPFPGGTRIDVRVDLREGEPMTLRNVPIGLHKQIANCINIFRGLNRHYCP